MHNTDLAEAKIQNEQKNIVASCHDRIWRNKVPLFVIYIFLFKC